MKASFEHIVESTPEIRHNTPMKIVFLAILLSVIFSLPTEAKPQLLDQVIAVVNDEAITQSELDNMLRPIYEQYKEQYKGEKLFKEITIARRKLLNQLIEDRLVFQAAKDKGLRIDPTHIDRQLDAFKKRFPSQEAMEEALSSQGLTVRAVREKFRRQAMVRALHNSEIRSKVIISPAEIHEYYDRNTHEFTKSTRIKVRSITIKKSDEARDKGLKDESAWEHLEKVRREIMGGADFNEMAKQHSQDVHAAKGGLGEWVEPKTMIPAIDEVIFGLRDKETSQIVETPMGYHVFTLAQKEEGSKRTFEEVRDEIEDKLYTLKSEDRFNEWMQELKSTAYISIR